ncbi:hypothetical protein [Hyphomonas sp.]|uniref:hypothetical protein n=1 Tax=Hyphomonas sp. TaxID=87 RepID=UPI0025C22654|nr:hypothetical protein [Hyphomonas sp.]
MKRGISARSSRFGQGLTLAIASPAKRRRRLPARSLMLVMIFPNGYRKRALSCAGSESARGSGHLHQAKDNPALLLPLPA